MKTIICGSRSITDYDWFCRCIERVRWKHKVSEVVSGTARGVDKLGERWAQERGIPVVRFPAAWDINGKAAGMLRNAEMRYYANAMLVFWDGSSKGTKDMIDHCFSPSVYKLFLEGIDNV